MLHRSIVPVIVLLTALPACSSSERDHSKPAPAPTTRPSAMGGEPAARGVQMLTGTLQRNTAAVGTDAAKGWTLAGDGAAGGMALDISKVTDRAKQLDGKRVTVMGHLSEQTLATTGRSHVLVVDSIEPVPTPAR